MIGLIKRLLIELLAKLCLLRPRPRGSQLDIGDLIDLELEEKQTVPPVPSTHAINNAVQNENNDRND